jgi:hypothetical protein
MSFSLPVQGWSRRKAAATEGIDPGSAAEIVRSCRGTINAINATTSGMVMAVAAPGTTLPSEPVVVESGVRDRLIPLKATLVPAVIGLAVSGSDPPPFWQPNSRMTTARATPSWLDSSVRAARVLRMIVWAVIVSKCFRDHGWRRSR